MSQGIDTTGYTREEGMTRSGKDRARLSEEVGKCEEMQTTKGNTEGREDNKA